MKDWGESVGELMIGGGGTITRNCTQYSVIRVFLPFVHVVFVSCVLLLVSSCLVCTCCWLAVCIVILFVFVVLCVHCFFFFLL